MTGRNDIETTDLTSAHYLTVNEWLLGEEMDRFLKPTRIGN